MSLTPHPLFRELIDHCEEQLKDADGNVDLGTPYAPSDGKWIALGLYAVAQAIDNSSTGDFTTIPVSDTIRGAEMIKEGLMEVAEMIKRVG